VLDRHFSRRAEGAGVCDHNPHAACACRSRRRFDARGSRAICAYVADAIRSETRPALGVPRAEISLLAVFFPRPLRRARDGAGRYQVEIIRWRRAGVDAHRVFTARTERWRKGPVILVMNHLGRGILSSASGLNFACAVKMVAVRAPRSTYIDLCAARPAFQRASASCRGNRGRSTTFQMHRPVIARLDVEPVIPETRDAHSSREAAVYWIPLSRDDGRIRGRARADLGTCRRLLRPILQIFRPWHRIML